MIQEGAEVIAGRLAQEGFDGVADLDLVPGVGAGKVLNRHLAFDLLRHGGPDLVHRGSGGKLNRYQSAAPEIDAVTKSAFSKNADNAGNR